MKTRWTRLVNLVLAASPAWAACEDDDTNGGSATTPSEVTAPADTDDATAADSTAETAAPGDTATTPDSPRAFVGPAEL